MKKLIEIDPLKMALNPYSFPLLIEVAKVTDNTKFIGHDGIFQANTFLIEKQQCVRMFYVPGLKDMLGNLSPGAKSLLLYILSDLDSGCDYFRINAKQYMKVNRVRSVNTYNSAVKELCRYCFISQSVDYKDAYWINPTFFYSGNRIAKYPNNLTIKSEIAK